MSCVEPQGPPADGVAAYVKLVRLAAVAALIAAAAPAAAAAQSPSDPCEGTVPDAVVSPASSAGATRELRVLVGLDGVTVPQAAEAMAAAARPYARLGLRLKVGAYVPVTTTGNDLQRVLEESRRRLGGRRPPWAHLVITLVDRALTPAQGLAWCIGGVRDPTKAFAVATYIRQGTGAGVLTPNPDNHGRLVAHELGHLMGATHEHGTCGEGVQDSPLTPCSLMVPQIPHFTALRFGAIDGSVVRGFASRYVKR